MDTPGGNTSTNTTNLIEDVVSMTTDPWTVPEWSKGVLYGLIGLVSVIGVPGNVVVVTTLLKVRLMTSTDWYLVFISLGDLLSLLVHNPMYVLITSTHIWKQVASTSLCRLHLYVLHVYFLFTNVFILAVGIDRFFKTCYPHKLIITPKRALVSCVVMTTVIFAVCLPLVFDATCNVNGQCIFGTERIRVGIYVTLLFVVITVSVLLTYIYLRICLVLKGRARTYPVARQNPQPDLQGNRVSTSNGIYPAVELQDFSQKPRMKHRSRIGLDLMARNLGNNTTKSCSVRSGAKAIGTAHQIGISTLSKVNHHVAVNCISVEPISGQVGDTRSRRHVAFTRGSSHYSTSGCPSSNRAEKTTMLVGVLTGVFAVCTIVPVITAVGLVASNSSGEDAVRIALFFLVRLYIVNNASNPVFFGILSSRFRRKAGELFKCR